MRSLYKNADLYIHISSKSPASRNHRLSPPEWYVTYQILGELSDQKRQRCLLHALIIIYGWNLLREIEKKETGADRKQFNGSATAFRTRHVIEDAGGALFPIGVTPPTVSADFRIKITEIHICQLFCTLSSVLLLTFCIHRSTLVYIV